MITPALPRSIATLHTGMQLSHAALALLWPPMIYWWDHAISSNRMGSGPIVRCDSITENTAVTLLVRNKRSNILHYALISTFGLAISFRMVRSRKTKSHSISLPGGVKYLPTTPDGVSWEIELRRNFCRNFWYWVLPRCHQPQIIGP